MGTGFDYFLDGCERAIDAATRVVWAGWPLLCAYSTLNNWHWWSWIVLPLCVIIEVVTLIAIGTEPD